MESRPSKWRGRALKVVIGLVVALILLLTLGRPLLVRELAGAWSQDPSAELSPAARALVERAYEGIDPARLVDFHNHIAGIGTGGTGCEVHPGMRSHWHPMRKLQFDFYLHASGVRNLDNADAEYVERLVDLVRNQEPHGRHFILAFDRHYDEEGNAVPDETEFHVPNEYVVELARRYSDVFLPAISVHPYRKDALDELDRYGVEGVRLVKWLPNAMGIDPSDPKCVPYYQRMEQWGMMLLSHAGEEKAVESEEMQAFGNPLRLRAALDQGVMVIAAHCGSLGTDLDDDGNEVPSFELFLRLMEDERYEGLFFGEISAMTQFNRMTGPLEVLLERPDVLPRLVNGSDYPLPAINVLYQTRQFLNQGWIDAEEREALNEIYDRNPLQFDFVLKRTLRHPTTGEALPASIFMLPEGVQVEWPLEVRREVEWPR